MAVRIGFDDNRDLEEKVDTLPIPAAVAGIVSPPVAPVALVSSALLRRPH